MIKRLFGGSSFLFKNHFHCFNFVKKTCFLSVSSISACKFIIISKDIGILLKNLA